jgi:DNA-binding response OmpR family regulator
VAHSPGREWLGVLMMHPATAALPIVASLTEPRPDAVLAAFRAGVADVCPAPVDASVLLSRLKLLLGDPPDPALRAGAIDRRGASILRRIGSFFRGLGFSGQLRVDAAGDPAVVPFHNGQLGETVYGDLRGAGALSALLTHPGEAPWDFSIEGPEPAVAMGVPVGEEADGGAFELEVAVGEPVEGLADPRTAELNALPAPRILLVDDDPSLLQLYQQFLKRGGWIVETANNGKEGFERALTMRPDLILSDIMMPETDGWGFLTQVRDDYRLRETKFVLLSCHTDYVENLRQLDAGADDYLEKGLRGDAIAERVAAVLAPRRNLLAALKPDSSFGGELASIGPQALLTSLSERGTSGTLEVDDSTTRYAIGFVAGKIARASATLGGHATLGDVALQSLLGVDNAAFVFDPATVPEDDASARPFANMRDELCDAMNARVHEYEERMLAEDTRLSFNAASTRFYRMVCPEPVRPLIESLEAGRSPREVMADSGASPLLVEWLVKDLLRKHIASFATDAADA